MFQKGIGTSCAAATFFLMELHLLIDGDGAAVLEIRTIPCEAKSLTFADTGKQSDRKDGLKAVFFKNAAICSSSKGVILDLSIQGRTQVSAGLKRI